MPKLHDLQPAFNAGEITPRLAARLDFIKYRSGLETCQNLIPLPEGGVMRRPGSRHVAEIKLSSIKGRLKRFQFSTTQAYVLEMCDSAMRFYRHQAQIAVANTDAVVANGTFASDISQSFSHVWQVDDTPTGTAYVDETGDANSTGNADWTLFPATENINDYAAFGYTTAFAQIRFDYANGTAGTDGVVAWEYWNGTTWTALTSVVDNTNSFKIAVADNLTVSWAIPSDWAARTISTSASLFWVRARITTVYTVNPILDQGFIRPSWTDKSTGGAGNQITYDATNLRLTLETNGTATDDIGWAEQAITTTATSVEHVLKFRVIGDPGDIIEFRVGSSPTGSQFLADVEKEAGYHCVAFTPTTSPFYIQFRNRGSNADKDVHIDDISLIDNAAVEIVTPWPEAELYDVEGPQSADVLYLFHDATPTYKLQRYGHTTWSLVEVAWQDGPYLDMNLTSTTLTPSAASGVAVTITASATTGINDNQGFLTTDVGRLVRIDNPAASVAWGWGIIVAYTSPTVVTVHVKKAFATTNADTRWRLGSWSETTGYPHIGTFFEQRLYTAATDTEPQTFWASQTADFENMKPDNDADTIEADDALQFMLSSDGVNAINWMSSGEDTLAIGTSGGEWVPSAQGIVITPLDITVKPQTTHGSARIQPARVGNVVLFVQAARRKVREFGFSFDINGYLAPDMTRLAQHITKGGIVEMDYAEEPESLVYAIRNDGQLLSMTFRRDEDIIGWGRHILGGVFGTGNAVVESIVVIPGANGGGQIQDSTDRDEVWLIVKRTINGATKRYIEFLEKYFETGDDQDDVYYADSLITYDGASTTTITGLTHLEGQTVKIWADGAIHPVKTVSSGQITLDTAASVVQIGLAYTHRLKTLKVSAGNPAGTPLGKIKRIYGLTFALLNSHTLKFGPSEDDLYEQDFRVVTDPMDAGASLFTGEKFVEFPGNWTQDARIVIESDDPAPFTLLALAPEVHINPLK